MNAPSFFPLRVAHRELHIASCSSHANPEGLDEFEKIAKFPHPVLYSTAP